MEIAYITLQEQVVKIFTSTHCSSFSVSWGASCAALELVDQNGVSQSVFLETLVEQNGISQNVIRESLVDQNGVSQSMFHETLVR